MEYFLFGYYAETALISYKDYIYSSLKSYSKLKNFYQNSKFLKPAIKNFEKLSWQRPFNMLVCKLNILNRG